MFLGTLFELSKSYPNFVALPEDLELLAASGYLGPILTIGLSFDFSILAGWASFFLPFVSWARRPIPSWVLGLNLFNGFRPTILFSCCELKPFITFP